MTPEYTYFEQYFQASLFPTPCEEGLSSLPASLPVLTFGFLLSGVHFCAAGLQSLAFPN